RRAHHLHTHRDRSFLRREGSGRNAGARGLGRRPRARLDGAAAVPVRQGVDRTPPRLHRPGPPLTEGVIRPRQERAMTGDYGREVAFGLFPSPGADPESQRALWAQVFAADRGGLDYIGIQDHPYQRRHMDTWMLMATVLARTERVRVFPDVANLPLRPPAVLATSAASLDVLSEGRFELGLGAGGFWEAIEAMGGPRRTPREAADALVEAVEIIRLMWSGER